MRAAIVDWLSFTVAASTFEDVPLDVYQLLKRWLPTVNLAEESRGPRNYFQFSRNFYAMVGFEPVLIGFVAWGGEGQRDKANIVLNGQGCSLVADWPHVSEWCNARDARLARVDVAVDFLEGEFTVDIAASRYVAGDFNWNNRPSHRQIGPWLDGDAEGKGRTLEVGKRINGKMCRVYEKGKQLGDPDSNWNRVEVELHNRDRVIPYDALTNPSHYFAGAYPFFRELLDTPPIRIPTFQAEFDVTVEAYTAHLKACYGKVINALRTQYTTDADMLNALSVAGIPKRLHKPSLKLIRNDIPEREVSPPRDEFEFGQDQRRFRAAM